MRIAVVGAGWAGDRQARAIAEHPETELGWVVDPDRDRAEALALRYGSGTTRTGADLDDLGDPDAVVLCSPTGVHAEQTLALVGRRIPVLVEKPFARTLAEAEQVAAAAAATGVPVMAAQILRSMPMFTAAAEAIAAGRLGTVVQVVERRLEDRRAAHPWWSQVPGFLVSHWGSHTVDLVCHLCDTGLPDGDDMAVACRASSVRHPGVVDTFTAQFRFADGPVMTTTMSMASRHEVHDLVFIGTEASLSFDCYRRVRLDDEVLVELGQEEMYVAGFATQWARFVDAVRSGQVRVGTPDSVVRSTRAVEAAVRSALGSM